MIYGFFNSFQNILHFFRIFLTHYDNIFQYLQDKYVKHLPGHVGAVAAVAINVSFFKKKSWDRINFQVY